MTQTNQVPETGLRDQPVWLKRVLVPGVIVFTIHEAELAILPERLLKSLQTGGRIRGMIPPGSIEMKTLSNLFDLCARSGWQCSFKLQESIIQYLAQAEISQGSSHIE